LRVAEPILDAEFPGSIYQVDRFVARYVAVWAYGVVGSPRLSEPYYRRIVELAAGALSAERPSVLDVGCGPGRVLADLAQWFPRARFVGVDRSSVMLDVARSILQGNRGQVVRVDPSDHGFPVASIGCLGLANVELRCQPVQGVADQGERFDLVVASHLLDRVSRPDQTLAALLDMVRPGGAVVLSNAFNYELRSQWDAMGSGEHLLDMLTEHGFEVDRFDDHFPYRELLDARGTRTEHRVAVVRARRPAPDRVDPPRTARPRRPAWPRGVQR
jgi:2-polyprenyl-3-methyl-5-hydroxy-6-metoxy-1,4-benzoquinol methylase